MNQKIIDFKEDLEKLINKHSMENLCDTPDHMLAMFLTKCLITYSETILARDRWFDD